MTKTLPLRMAYMRFTSCSGCQLMLLNCEERLAALSLLVSVHEFPLASSNTQTEQIELALVEGSISTPDELTRLLNLRRRVKLLVAVGSCALSGGINSLVAGERAEAINGVYGQVQAGLHSFPPQPVHRFVTVDCQVPDIPAREENGIDHKGIGGHGQLPICCRQQGTIMVLLQELISKQRVEHPVDQLFRKLSSAAMCKQYMFIFRFGYGALKAEVGSDIHRFRFCLSAVFVPRYL